MRPLTAEQRADRRVHVCVKGCDLLHPHINVPLLRKIKSEIEAHPETWNQEIWVTTQIGYKFSRKFFPNSNRMGALKAQEQANSCGTAFCVAGHAAMLSGDPLASGLIDGFRIYTSQTESGDSVQTRGLHELGLTLNEAGELFNGSNTWGRIISLFRSLAALEGEEL
jgi:hypothetical protein